MANKAAKGNAKNKYKFFKENKAREKFWSMYRRILARNHRHPETEG